MLRKFAAVCAALLFAAILHVDVASAVTATRLWSNSAEVSTSNPLPVTGTLTTSPSGTQDTNLKQVNGATVATGAGTASGSQRVELPTDGTGKVGLNAGSAIVGKVGIDQTTDGTTNRVNANVAQFSGTAAVNGSGTATGALRVELPTNGTGVVGLNAGSALVGAVNLNAATTGGCTPYHFLSLASNNATNVKSSAATLCFVSAINTTGTLYYLKLFNQAAAPSTCATDSANVVLNFPISASTAGAGFAIPLSSFGAAFSTGLSFCITAGSADNDNTSAATGVNLNMGYK